MSSDPYSVGNVPIVSRRVKEWISDLYENGRTLYIRENGNLLSCVTYRGDGLFQMVDSHGSHDQDSLYLVWMLVWLDSRDNVTSNTIPAPPSPTSQLRWLHRVAGLEEAS